MLYLFYVEFTLLTIIYKFTTQQWWEQPKTGDTNLLCHQWGTMSQMPMPFHQRGTTLAGQQGLRPMTLAPNPLHKSWRLMGGLLSLSSTPPMSLLSFDLLVGFNSLLHTMPAPKPIHESWWLVGELLSHFQHHLWHHQQVITTCWWVSTPSHTQHRPQTHPQVTMTSGWDLKTGYFTGARDMLSLHYSLYVSFFSYFFYILAY